MLRFLIYLCIGCISITTCMAQSNRTIDAYVNKMIQKIDPKMQFGVAIYDETTNTMLYSRNSSQHFVPASTLKIFTAAAALLDLKQHFRFQTRLLSNKQDVVDGHLQGDLYIQFTGDPELKSRDVQLMIQSLSQRGVRYIDGNIYIDDTVLGEEYRAPGTDEDDSAYCYSAPIDAIVIDRNCLRGWVKPGTTPQRAQIQTKAGYHQFINALTQRPRNQRYCPIHIDAKNNNRLIVTGCAPKQTQFFEMPIPDPITNAKLLIRFQLNAASIKHRTPITNKKAPTDAYVLAYHESPHLGELVTTMLKDSDNLIADSLLKTLGQHYFQTQGTWKNGSLARKKIYDNAKLYFNSTNMVDGSGLSRENRVSPMDMLKLLHFIYNHFEISYEFISALPISGVDGTLHRRLAGPQLKGKIRAKTGTLSHVSSLAGYIQTPTNHVISFAIISNGRNKHTSGYKLLEDKLVSYFAGLRDLN